MVSTHLFTVNTLEPVLWTLLALCVLQLLERPSLPRWLGIGVLVGVGVSNKYSMAFWALALLLGVVLSGRRRVLVAPGLAAALLLGCALPLPSILWQADTAGPSSSSWARARQARTRRSRQPRS